MTDLTTASRSRWLALYVLCLGDLMIVLDSSIVNVALPSIQDDLGFSQSALAWVVNAYLLTFGGFLLLSGRLGDLLGNRRVFLGGVVDPAVVSRLEAAPEHGDVLVASRRFSHPSYDEATVRTPTLIRLTADDADTYSSECFGPVAYLIETADTDESISLFGHTVERHGAMTASVYSTSEKVVDEMREAALDVGVALSENLHGAVFVNQSAAYSDFHGTGANPAANATYTDGAYVASRFRVIQSRRHV